MLGQPDPRRLRFAAFGGGRFVREPLVAEFAGALHSAHEPFELVAGGVAGHPDVVPLVGWGGDPADRPDLAVGQPTFSKRCRDRRQLPKGSGDPYPFAGGVTSHAEPPGQPMNAGQDAVDGPGAAFVELTDVTAAMRWAGWGARRPDSWRNATDHH
jgi:hypothetical protein